jgi:hypothetical protein
VRLDDEQKREQPIAIVKPDGAKVMVPSDSPTYPATDMPGVYSITTANGPQNFAVNIDPLESRTAPVAAETLEQFGVRLVGPGVTPQNDQQKRQLQDMQLESRQKIWQWLIMAALGIVVAETWLAGRATKPPVSEGAPA